MSKSRTAWSFCSVCGKKTRSLRIGREGFVCFSCSRNPYKIIRVGDKSPKKNIEEVLNKVHEIKGKINKKNKGIYIKNISIPQILIGHKVKLVLVE